MAPEVAIERQAPTEQIPEALIEGANDNQPGRLRVLAQSAGNFGRQVINAVEAPVAIGLSTAVAFAGGAALKGSTAESQAAGAAFGEISKKKKPMQPKSLVRGITRTFDLHTDGFLVTTDPASKIMKVDKATLTQGTLSLRDDCDGWAKNRKSRMRMRYVITRPKRQKEDDCGVNDPLENSGFRDHSDDHFKPSLDSLGDRAARSVRIDDDEVGDTKKITSTKKKATIIYVKDSEKIGKQLKKLILYSKKKPKKYFYK